MPHRVKMPKLGKDSSHRMAMLRNMVTSLFKYERIETTTPKAKALRRVADNMITKGKEGTLESFKRVNGFVRERPEVNKVMIELAERYKYRPGGYTRVIRTRRRKGDFAEMAYIELVDRDGELRPARKCDAEYAIAKGFTESEITRFSPIVFGEGVNRRLRFLQPKAEKEMKETQTKPAGGMFRAEAAKLGEAIIAAQARSKKAEKEARAAAK